jgi:hypothetical protein
MAMRRASSRVSRFAGFYAAGNAGGRREIDAYLGHCNIQNTTRDTALAPGSHACRGRRWRAVAAGMEEDRWRLPRTRHSIVSYASTSDSSLGSLHHLVRLRTPIKKGRHAGFVPSTATLSAPASMLIRDPDGVDVRRVLRCGRGGAFPSSVRDPCVGPQAWVKPNFPRSGLPTKSDVKASTALSEARLWIRYLRQDLVRNIVPCPALSPTLWNRLEAPS